MPLEEMNCRWVEGRVPRIDLAQLRRHCDDDDNVTAAPLPPSAAETPTFR